MATGPMLVQPLKELCIRAVSSNFGASPTFGGLPEASCKRVVEGLPLDLPLELVGALITDEGYWQRRAAARWRNCDPAAHGRSWKQLYFERHLQEALERYDPASDDLNALKRLMAFSHRFARNVRAAELPSRLDAQVLFDAMGNSPSSLALSYGSKALGMDYDRSLAGMQLGDCRCLARALAHAETLVHLDLSNNALDDDKALMLASGLADNISLTHLDLSHNKIADRGARTLARVLDASSPLAVLDLSDNQLHAEGGRALGRALRASCGLVSLDVRLNRLGDAGVKALLEGLLRPAGGGGGGGGGGAPLERLGVAANGAGGGAAAALAAALRGCRSLARVDASGNPLGLAAGAALAAAARESAGLAALDVRRCGIGGDHEAAIAEELLARAERRARGGGAGGGGGGAGLS
ncbi:MAG: flagellar associated protein [Monoraphidium minutum]|nr:MAG: flagellar associated protein [Monoraphidium minutum]